MTNRRSRTLLAVLTVLFLWGSRTAGAAPTSASANIFFPAIDDSRYISIYGSQTLQQWQYRFGGYFNYANDPLEIGWAGTRRFGVIDHLIVMDLFGSAGMTDWFQIGINLPVVLYEDFNDFTTATSSKIMRLGDLRFETKFRLLDIDRHHFGISLLPFITFGTGGSAAGDKFVGNNAITGGVKAIFDVDIKQRVQISANLGYLARPHAGFLTGTEQDDMFTYGLGVSVRAVKNWMDVIGEIYGNTNVTNFFSRESELPLEVDAGLRFNLPKPEGLQITAGGGLGLTYGFGTPDFRAILGVSYLKPRRVELPPPPPPEEAVAKVEKKKIIITKKIHFEFDKAVIRPISFRILDAVVDIMKENPDIHKVRVEGHCDAKGSDAYNIKLSQRRSNAVRDYLISHGIEADRLVAIGYGESKPVATNDTAEGRAQNRRVEFTILDQEGVAPDAN